MLWSNCHIDGYNSSFFSSVFIAAGFKGGASHLASPFSSVECVCFTSVYSFVPWKWKIWAWLHFITLETSYHCMRDRTVHSLSSHYHTPEWWKRKILAFKYLPQTVGTDPFIPGGCSHQQYTCAVPTAHTAVNSQKLCSTLAPHTISIY